MELTKDALQSMGQAYKKATTQHVIEQSIKQNGIAASTEREKVTITKNNFVFSVDVDDEAVANQEQSGRCWMFSALNFLRFHIEKNLNLKHGTFQLSQAYLFFYDKLEKANFFMEHIIESAGSSLDDRRVDFLLQTPQQDGGDWDIIAGLIQKYGVVPLEAMPETACTRDSSDTDNLLNQMLRQDALELRDLVRKDTPADALDARRTQMLSDIYRVLAVCMGEPPQTVDFVYRDAKGTYHQNLGLTPLEFYKKYCPFDLDDYIGVINLPVDYAPYGKMYTIDMTNEPVGGRKLRYLNVPMDVLKQCTIAQLKAGEPVWFGCDVTQDADFQKGILALDLYDTQAAFDIKLTMDKAQRFQSYQSLPTHAMTMAGVDIVGEKPTRWKVENSWGATNDGKPVGHNGYFIMDDSWFDAYMYEVAIRKDLIPEPYRSALGAEPEVWPYWNIFNPLP